MKTLSKLTIKELEDPKPFSLFPELQTEYRIIKITPFITPGYYLQFKDNYRIFGIKTPFTVWRFVPKVAGNWKKYDCPVVYNKPAFMLFICNTNNPKEYLYCYLNTDKKYLRKFTQVFPSIDYYLDELTREYRKKNDKTEYL